MYALIANCLYAAYLGWMLGAAGLTIKDWKFWAIIVPTIVLSSRAWIAILN